MLVATATFLTLTNRDALSEVQHSLESCLAISDPEKVLAILNLLQIVISLRALLLLIRAHLAWQKLRAVEADALEDLREVPQHSLVVHWAIQGYVAEMTGTSLHTRLARIAPLVLVCDTHARIVHCVEVGLKGSLVVDLRGTDLCDRHLAHVVRGEETELESFDAFVRDCKGL